jgi:hypothetical protein
VIFDAAAMGTGATYTTSTRQLSRTQAEVTIQVGEYQPSRKINAKATGHELQMMVE